jgi:hypothetical protein
MLTHSNKNNFQNPRYLAITNPFSCELPVPGMNSISNNFLNVRKLTKIADIQTSGVLF